MSAVARRVSASTDAALTEPFARRSVSWCRRFAISSLFALSCGWRVAFACAASMCVFSALVTNAASPDGAGAGADDAADDDVAPPAGGGGTAVFSARGGGGAWCAGVGIAGDSGRLPCAAPPIGGVKMPVDCVGGGGVGVKIVGCGAVCVGGCADAAGL